MVISQRNGAKDSYVYPMWISYPSCGRIHLFSDQGLTEVTKNYPCKFDFQKYLQFTFKTRL